MTDISITRDAAQIAREINTIKEGVRETLLHASIEIGRRLHEAKSVVPYGEWGKWLNENVDYSESTAQNLMRIADTYGRKESQALADISYTQAVLLLRLPAEEREQFVQEHDMESISTRDLQAEIKRLTEENARKQLTIDEMMGLVPAGTSGEQPPKDAQTITMVDETELQGVREQLEEAERIAEDERQRVKDLQKSLEAARAQVAESEKRREDELRKAAAKAEQAEKERKKAEEERDEARRKEKARSVQLERTEEELKAAREQVRTVEVMPRQAAEELERLRAQASRSGAESEMRAAYDNLVAAFERLMTKLGDAKETDPETAAKFGGAFAQAMAKMAERVRDA